MTGRDERRPGRRPARRPIGGGREGRWAARAAAVAAVVLLAAPAGAQELPGGLELSGGIYLYHHQPLDLTGVDATTEVYALFLDLDRSEGPWTIHVQGRWRDTKLRAFYPSNVWLQEAWVAYERPLGEDDGAPRGAGDEDGARADPDGGPAPTLTLRAGKIYQRIGRFWDGSFFGNVHYFDGLKLDPEFGAEAVLEAPLGGEGATAELYLQGLAASDRVNGALAGRDLEGRDDLEESGAAAGLRLSTPLARVLGRDLRGTVGVSGLAERVEAPESDPSGAGATLEHVAADLELALDGAGRLYVEWTRRASGGPGTLSGLGPVGSVAERGVAGSRATWWLAGVRADLGRLGLRYNLSTARYDDGEFREWIHQPGLTFRAHDSVSLLLEYDDWRRVPSGPLPTPAAGSPARSIHLDRSLNLVLLLTF